MDFSAAINQIKFALEIECSIYERSYEFPNPGQILLCDFSVGFEKPEMVKKNRPVVILSGAIQGRDNLATIVPISSTTPEPKQLYHYKLPKK